MKCIVKNCPDCILDSWENEYKELEEGYMCKRRKMHDCECMYIPNCFMKKIVKTCIQMKDEYTPELASGKYNEKFRWFKSGRADAGKEILSLLEIERINDADIQP